MALLPSIALGRNEIRSGNGAKTALGKIDRLVVTRAIGLSAFRMRKGYVSIVGSGTSVHTGITTLYVIFEKLRTAIPLLGSHGHLNRFLLPALRESMRLKCLQNVIAGGSISIFARKNYPVHYFRCKPMHKIFDQ